TVVNLDPHHTQEATVTLDLPEETKVRDALTGEIYLWGGRNYVRLDPAHSPAHLLTVRQDG
ncbi:alpha-amylase, partial [Kitasatospora paranensis]